MSKKKEVELPKVEVQKPTKTDCKHQNQADNKSVITCLDCGLIIKQ